MKYTVRRGDTMRRIAAAHEVSVGTLIRANPQIEDPSLIFPGQVLTIPGVPSTEEPAFEEVYRVRSGDTLGKIARNFGVRLDQLLAANPQISDPDVIHIGDAIMVPVSGPGETVQKVTSPPGGAAPLWYRIAKREMSDNVVEFPGADIHNPRILDYHATVSEGLDQNEIPWCSSFVNWCIEQADVRGTDSAAARSWERWGKALPEPKVGAVTVFWRESKSSGLGHVGFFVKQTSESVSVLGGNQGNTVSVAAYPKARLLSYRWPKV